VEKIFEWCHFSNTKIVKRAKKYTPTARKDGQKGGK